MHNGSKTAPNSDISALLVSLGFLCGLFLMATVVDAPRLWSMNYWRHYSVATNASLLSVCVAATIILWQRLRSTDYHLSIRTEMVIVTVTSLGLISMFLLLRAQTHFLGDGYALMSALPTGGQALKSRNLGGMLVPYGLMHFFGRPDEHGALLSYRIVSVVSGAAFIFVAFQLARDLMKNASDQLLLWIGICSGGYSLLFFGYVENYSLFSVGVLAFCHCGIGICQNRFPRSWILVVWALCAFMHIFGLALLPAAVYVLFRASSPVSFVGRRHVQFVIWGSLVLLAVVLVGVLFATNLFVRFAFVPLVDSRIAVAGYFLFSWPHLIDFLNLIVIVAPGSLVFLASSIGGLKNALKSDIAGIRFLLIVAISMLIVAFVVNPMLGMPRDWDLFAAGGVPITVLIYYCILSPHNSRARAVSSMAIILSATLLMSRAAIIASPKTGIQFARDYIVLDPEKNRTLGFTYARVVSERYGPDSILGVQKQFEGLWPDDGLADSGITIMLDGDYTRASGYFERALQLNPLNYDAWANLGRCLVYQSQFDSAVVTMRIASGLNPYSSEIATMRGFAELYAHNYDEARDELLKGRKLDTANSAALIGLVELAKSVEDTLVRLAYLDTLTQRGDAPLGYIVQQIEESARKAHFDKAGILLKKAIDQGLGRSQVDHLLLLYPGIPLTD